MPDDSEKPNEAKKNAGNVKEEAAPKRMKKLTILTGFVANVNMATKFTKKTISQALLALRNLIKSMTSFWLFVL